MTESEYEHTGAPATALLAALAAEQDGIGETIRTALSEGDHALYARLVARKTALASELVFARVAVLREKRATVPARRADLLARQEHSEEVRATTYAALQASFAETRRCQEAHALADGDMQSATAALADLNAEDRALGLECDRLLAQLTPA